MKTINPVYRKVIAVIIGITVLLCLCASGCGKPEKQQKADVKTVLSLGDSISAGYGLDNASKEGFVSLIGEAGYNVDNMAVNGNTAVGILDQLNNPENPNYISPEQVKNADIVTITCGGNDLMALLYQKIAEIWNAENPEETIETSAVLGKLEKIDLGLMSSVLKLLDKEDEAYIVNSAEFSSTLNTYITNLNAVTEYIKSVNPKAKIFVATQYNPYAEFKEKSISFIVSFDLNSIYSGMEEGVTKLNDAIISNSAAGDYTVVDVKSAFDAVMAEEGADLYNADPNTKSFNVDFHPNAAGHKVIADAFTEAIK